MISRSCPSILTSVPDHFPNSTRVAFFEVDREQVLPLSFAPAGADRDHFALLRLSPWRCRE